MKNETKTYKIKYIIQWFSIIGNESHSTQTEDILIVEAKTPQKALDKARKLISKDLEGVSNLESMESYNSASYQIVDIDNIS